MSNPNLPPSAPPPGGGAPPPGQPYQGGAGGAAPLDVGSAFSYSWNKFSENVGAFIGLVLVVWLVGVVLSFINYALANDGGAFFQALLSLVILVLVMIVQAGVWRAGLAVTRGEKPEISMITQMDNIGPYILTSIIVGVVTAIGIVFCVIPGLIWLVFTAFAPLFALDKGASPFDAIGRSMSWVKDNFGAVFAILLVAWLVYIAGFLLCGVGALVSIPVGLVMLTYTYRCLGGEPVV